MTLQERCESYNTVFKKWPDSWLFCHKRFIIGTWMIGQNFRSKKKFYGEYPRTYLRRIMAMFPDKRKVLHIFGGSLQIAELDAKYPHHDHWIVEINKDLCEDFNNENYVIGDAHKMSGFFTESFFDLILADPPYSEEDADHYGTPMINRRSVMAECHKILSPGGILVWLDQVFPMYKKTKWNLVGTIGLVRSTNNRVRMVFIFERC